jgi:hypothetical protein
MIKFYERLILDMREENQRMRDINKELLLQLNEAQVFTTSLIKEGAPSGSSSMDLRTGLSPMKTTSDNGGGALSTQRRYEDASKIHTLYQELFLTDMKRDL